MVLQHSENVGWYIAALKELYAHIRNWLEDTPITVQETINDISEENIGTYKAPGLRLMNELDRPIVTIAPVGTQIVGASGRADFIGPMDRENIFFFKQGGPSMTVGVQAPGENKTRVSPLYRGITTTGWYWIDDRRRAEAHPLNETLFLDLIARVSDYECAS